jgi:hypothetical protein
MGRTTFSIALSGHGDDVAIADLEAAFGDGVRALRETGLQVNGHLNADDDRDPQSAISVQAGAVDAAAPKADVAEEEADDKADES